MSRGTVGNRCPKCGGIANTVGAGGEYLCTNGLTKLEMVEGVERGHIVSCNTHFTALASKRITL